MLVDLFADRVWQMSLGERAAIEGVLTRLRPALAVELGTAEGASLSRIAEHAAEVHSFDLVAPQLELPPNVVLHTGDSHELLPRFLAETADHGRNIDFVLVDGDHSAEGVRRDLEDLLDSPAVARTVILIHDTANEEVRAGVDAVHYLAWPKVAYVELDWVPGRLFAQPELHNQLWSGLGLVIVDSQRTVADGDGHVYDQRYVPTGELLAQMRELVVARERLPLDHPDPDDPVWLRKRMLDLAREVTEARDAETRAWAAVEEERRRSEDLANRLRSAEELRLRDQRTIEGLTGSMSWKLTAPLRAGKPRRRPSAG